MVGYTGQRLDQTVIASHMLSFTEQEEKGVWLTVQSADEEVFVRSEVCVDGLDAVQS